MPGGGRSIGAWLDVIASDSAAQALDVVREQLAGSANGA